uniref:Secreted protein n=1 Tax=Macrostomum lignano TaxID=282301 RepID=A0A1I8GFY7_9PLAT
MLRLLSLFAVALALLAAQASVSASPVGKRFLFWPCLGWGAGCQQEEADATVPHKAGGGHRQSVFFRSSWYPGVKRGRGGFALTGGRPTENDSGASVGSATHRQTQRRELNC